MSFPGMPPQMGGGAAAGMDPQKLQEQQMIKMMQKGMESCPVKMALAGGMGFGLGGLFGLFMASMRYDTPMSSAGGIPGTMGPDGVKVPEIPMRQQIKAGFKDMGKSSWASAKNFGYIGGVYSGSECVIEGFRGKNDLANGVAAGCFTGGFLAKSAGPQAMAIGCAGFAAFSAAIDAYMRMDSNDVAADPII